MKTRRTTTNIRTISASILALDLLASAASAASGPAGSQVNNRISDYGVLEVVETSTQALGVVVEKSVPRNSIGDFIDETNVEKNQRSGN